jgi:hypothetical protein
MTLRQFISTISIAVALTTPAPSIAMEASEFYKLCTAPWSKQEAGTFDESDGADMAFCYGYIRGLADSTRFAVELTDETTLWACIPQEASTSQLRKVAVKYIDEHPDKLHFPTSVVLSLAFLDSFPCK